MPIRQSVFTLVAVLASGICSSTVVATPIQELWKISSRADWPPVPAATAVVFKSGNSLTAHALTDGTTTWTAKFRSLASGPAVMAAGAGHVYVIGKRGLIRLSLDGKVQSTRKLKAAASVLFGNDSIYVSTRDSVLRFDSKGERELGKAAVKGGWIRQVSGRHAAVYSRQKQPRGSRKSPELLQVFDLATGKAVYQFRLLPDGAHRVVQMSDERLTFVDYTRRDRRGKNRKKLYFTVVDYRTNKKLRDLALSKLYASEQSDNVWVTVDRRGAIYVATHGKAGDDANVAGFDPARRKTLWERLGTAPNRGLLLYDGLLWSAITDDNGATKLTGIDPASGKAKVRLPLDGRAVKAPAEVAGRLFVRTAKSVYCFGPATADPHPTAADTTGPAAATAPSPSPAPASSVDEPAAGHLTVGTDQTATPPPAEDGLMEPGDADSAEPDLSPQPLGQRPGWLGYQDRRLGFRIQLPRTWALDRKRVRRLGGARAVIPFARKKEISRRKYYLGTVQVLTWEAAGRDADALWRSVYVQRKKLSPDVQVSRVHRVRNVGGSGLSGVVARYSFNGPGGQQVTLRSLCVVSNGTAFELRAWAGPIRPKRTWRDIGEIFSSFQPEK